MFGYTIDTADGQWRDLRDKMWLLWVAMIAVTIAHFVFKIMTIGTKFGNKKKINIKDHQTSSTRSSSLSMDSNNNPIDDNVTKYELEEDIPPSSYFRLIVGIGFIILLHGRHSLVVLLISYLGFKLAKSQTNSKNSTLYTWLYAISILLFKESYRLQHRTQFHFLRPIFDRTYGGLYGWQLPANFLILRIISFCFDYHWSCSYHKDKSNLNNEKAIPITPTNINDDKKSILRNRNKSSSSTDSNETIISNIIKEETQPNQNKHRQLNEYNFINFIAYILYPPLYMAGPIMSFNDFVENTKNPQKSEGKTKTILLSIY
jgi:D-alanyl-lipoteichoic acid acyltransferase DltB (MBOAT superfamily)